ncbi:hypothetical protein CR513_52720, partial [Mucuna pruriens]
MALCHYTFCSYNLREDCERRERELGRGRRKKIKEGLPIKKIVENCSRQGILEADWYIASQVLIVKEGAFTLLQMVVVPLLMVKQSIPPSCDTWLVEPRVSPHGALSLALEWCVNAIMRIVSAFNLHPHIRVSRRRRFILGCWLAKGKSSSKGRRLRLVPPMKPHLAPKS